MLRKSQKVVCAWISLMLEKHRKNYPFEMKDILFTRAEIHRRTEEIFREEISDYIVKQITIGGPVTSRDDLLVGVGGVLAKALAIIMTAAAGWLFFCTSFSGGNAVIVILTATALFWLPELAGILLAGLVLLQRKIADSLLV